MARCKQSEMTVVMVGWEAAVAQTETAAWPSSNQA